MIAYLVRQDLAQRFAGNTLGLAWAVLAPLLQLAVFATVFQLIFKARVPGLDGAGYVVYLSLGMWPWFALSDAIGRGATTYTDQAALLSKVAIAPWKLVAARVITAFLLHGLGFLVVTILLWLFTPHVTPAWLPLTLPAWIALAGIAFAGAMWVAVLNVFFRDVQQIAQYLLTAFMFMTPILYAASTGPEALARAQQWNPFASAIGGIRDPLMGQGWQSPWLAWLFAVLALAVALWSYRRFRSSLVDFL
ncbi:MAG: ABC transporter permease [Lysobacteraceae bacterium]